jgi:hypothetical protein
MTAHAATAMIQQGKRLRRAGKIAYATMQRAQK